MNEDRYTVELTEGELRWLIHMRNQAANETIFNKPLGYFTNDAQEHIDRAAELAHILWPEGDEE